MSVRRKRRREKEDESGALDEVEVFIDTTCEICNAEFVDFEDLQQHKEQVHPGESLTNIEILEPEELLEKPQPIFTGYNCYFCNENFSNREWLSLHIRDEHIKDLDCCQYCLRLFTNEKMLKSHQQLHISNIIGFYSCSHCPSFLKSTTALQEHEYKEHKDDKDGVMLNDCFPHLSSILNMRVDEFFKSMHRTSQLYICVCDFKSSDPMGYLDHLKKKGCSSLVCNTCLRPYKNMKSLKRHYENTCRSTKPTTRFCNNCKKDIPRLEFGMHRRRCLYASSCKICHKKISGKEEMKAHQQEHAMVIKKKTCYYCRMELFNVKDYKNHVEKCHGSNYRMYRYPCGYCQGFIFNHPQKLFAHFYSRHKDISPYRCNICEKDFRIRKQFTLHIKLVHKSVGFVEFTEALNVHFNAEKSENAYVPAGPDRLFDSSDEEDFKNSGLYNTKPKIIKKKRIRKKVDDSDDEPLMKKRKIKPLNKLASLLKNRKKSPRLTCKICKKFCYTVQNYNRHVSLHFKENIKSCVKCGATFKSKKALDKHLQQAHETTHITSKLKTLLEKKKHGAKYDFNERSKISIRNTIKKIVIDSPGIPATVRVIRENSAKNFLETFSPEVEKTEKKIDINASVSIKPVKNKLKPFSIKMVQCDLRPLPVTRTLKMPERVDLTNDLIRARLKIRPSKPNEPKAKPRLNFGVREDHMNFIPEVAEEVIYEAKDETEICVKDTEVNDYLNKDYAEIVIPEHYNPAKMQVATLHSEAPYFKIVPLAHLAKMPTIEQEYKNVDEIQLPTGTLVRSNPLAHLMKGRDIKLTNSYEPKLKNPQKALANAIMKLKQKEQQNVKTKRAKRQTTKQKKSTASVEKQDEITNE